MIFPNKYLKFDKSLLNLGSIIIKSMKKGLWYSVDEIWRNIKSDATKYNFNDLILTLDFLFGTNCIDIDDEGKICLN